MEEESRPLRSSGRHTVVREAMATTFKVTLAHGDAVYARQAGAAALAELDRIEGLLSRFVESSDISRINGLERGSGTVVQLDTFDCLRIALEVHRETGGAFDVAYGSRGPWSARPRFELDETSHTVRVLDDGVRLDLGGIGKGFALDRMAALLADWDVTAALLAASTSTVLAAGPPPGADGWPIVFGPDGKTQKLCLKDRAFSGSGTAVRGSHIMDPRTRRPATGAIRAWAGAPTAAVADALSTAFMVMSETEVRDYCRRHPEITAWRQESF
jgi:thiamine biosynthesis lipoprotein